MIGEKWRGYYLTAYGIAVKHGYKGTEEEWLESLVGPEGKRLELDVVDGNLMYRHVGDEEYKLLLSVEDFRGEEIDLLVSELSSAKADAIASAADASASEKQAKNYAENASTSETNAQTAAQSAEKSAQSAETNAQNTKQYALETKGYADSASLSKANAQISAQSAETNAQTAERYASEAKTARDEAVEIAGFDPTNYVQKNDLAEINGDAGLTHLSSPTYGINLKDTNKDGIYRLIVYGAKEEQIVEKKNAFMPLTPSFIDLAVKVGLTTNTTILTDDEKTAALTWLGLMSEGIFNFDNTVGINAMLNMNGNVFQTEACEIMNGNEHYLHSGNIFQHTNTVHYTSYSGTGSVPTETSPAIIEDLPSGVHFGILMDISDGILNNAWYIDVSTADGETTFITLKDSGGNNCIVKMRYMITAPGVYDSVYRLEWYNTSNAPTAKQLMNESGRKYAFMYM